MLLGSALTVGRITVNAVAVGSIVGSSYAMGRKYGRVICEKLDDEGRITAALSSSISE